MFPSINLSSYIMSPYTIKTIDNKTILKIEVPGIPKEDIEILLEGRELEILFKGAHRNKYHYYFILNIPPENIEASLNLGILTITISHKKDKGRLIEINTN